MTSLKVCAPVYNASTATATTAIEVLVLSQQGLREAVDEVPGLGWKLLQTVAERLSDSSTGLS